MDEKGPARPYLVQRLIDRASPLESAESVDRDFELDYMGAAEFEFGEPCRQLDVMAGIAGKLAIVETVHGGHSLWYLGRLEQLPEAAALAGDQVPGTCSYRLKESTLMHRRLHGQNPWTMRINGWWAYATIHSRIEYPWALFTSERLAALFLDGVQRWAEKNTTKET